jgi:hypothetical protein
MFPLSENYIAINKGIFQSDILIYSLLLQYSVMYSQLDTVFGLVTGLPEQL